MNMFTKLDMYLDYNNHYSLNKALNTLQREFGLAMSRKNNAYAQEVAHTLNKVYSKLTDTYKESADYSETMSYSQKLMANKMRWLQSYMRTELGNSNYEQEIEQAIQPTI